MEEPIEAHANSVDRLGDPLAGSTTDRSVCDSKIKLTRSECKEDKKATCFKFSAFRELKEPQISGEHQLPAIEPLAERHFGEKVWWEASEKYLNIGFQILKTTSTSNLEALNDKL